LQFIYSYLRSDSLVGNTIGGKQDDPAPAHHPLSGCMSPDPSFQLGSFFVGNHKQRRMMADLQPGKLDSRRKVWSTNPLERLNG
jgi:hypothetical protein